MNALLPILKETLQFLKRDPKETRFFQNKRPKRDLRLVKKETPFLKRDPEETRFFLHKINFKGPICV